MISETEAFEKIHRLIYNFAQGFTDEEIKYDYVDKFTYKLLEILGFKNRKLRKAKDKNKKMKQE